MGVRPSDLLKGSCSHSGTCQLAHDRAPLSGAAPRQWRSPAGRQGADHHRPAGETAFRQALLHVSPSARPRLSQDPLWSEDLRMQPLPPRLSFHKRQISSVACSSSFWLLLPPWSPRGWSLACLISSGTCLLDAQVIAEVVQENHCFVDLFSYH